jgi:AraC-like DNA-binding protein
MRYKEFPARPPLARYVECFWTLEGCAASGTQAPQRILPDGCMELILNFAQPFRRHQGNGTTRVQPLFMLVGQLERHLEIEPTGPVELVGVRFRPAGAVPFLRFPIHELTGRFEPLAFVLPKFGRAVEGPVCESRGLAQKVAAVESILLELLRGAAEPDIRIEEGVRRILARRGRIAVRELARDLGMGERQLERGFNEAVGLSPKVLARIIRFQRVFQEVDGSRAPNWAGVALDCGYYDQAHFVKDFRQFSGQTPTELFAERAALTAVFTRKNRVSEIYKTDSR